MFRSVLIVAFALALTSSAGAQRFMRPGEAPLAEGEIAIQSQRSLILRPSNEEDLGKAQEDGIKLIYKMAERECALALETIASECELVSVNTNVSANEGGERLPTIRVSGSFGLKVKLKSR